LKCNQSGKALQTLNKNIADLKVREEEREFRENEIRKEFALFEKASFLLCEKQLRKLVRKMLMLTIEKHQSGL
jgi:hypothetical protein